MRSERRSKWLSFSWLATYPHRIDTETSSGVIHDYAHDMAGNRLTAKYGDGSGSTCLTLSSTYDALNRTMAMSENGRVSTYRYDLAGNIREKGQPNGDTIRKSFDRLDRTLAIHGPEGSDTQPLYQYDKAYDLYNNLAKIKETYPSVDSVFTTQRETYIKDLKRTLIGDLGEEGVQIKEIIVLMAKT